MKLYGPTGRPWECEFFKLAGYMLQCKLRACNQHPERIGVLMGELDYGAEMGRVLKDRGAPLCPLFGSRRMADMLRVKRLTPAPRSPLSI